MPLPLPCTTDPVKNKAVIAFSVSDEPVATTTASDPRVSNPPAMIIDDACMFTVAAAAEEIEIASPACSVDEEPNVSVEPSMDRSVAEYKVVLAPHEPTQPPEMTKPASAEKRHEEEDDAEILPPETVIASCESMITPLATVRAVETNVVTPEVAILEEEPRFATHPAAQFRLPAVIETPASTETE